MKRFPQLQVRLQSHILALLIGVTALLSLSAGAAELKPFKAQDMATIESHYQDEPFLLALWSLTCPPCLRELEMFNQWQQENPDVPLVLINTDPPSEAGAAARKLAEVGLEDADNWMFADNFVEKLRHAIDPSWRGELPRSYLYSKNERHAISGILTHDQLNNWLADTTPPALDE